MKKIVVFMFMLLLLTGCSEEKGNRDTENMESLTVADTEMQGHSVETETMTETMLDLEKYSLENKDDTYSQTGFLWNEAASSELGIYYWGNLTLNFYDKNANIGVPLCNRPNCKHDSNDCNAAFGIFVDTGLDMYRNMVFYYDGNVFLVGDENNYVNLYKVKPDGSAWEKEMELFKAEKTVEITEDGGTSTSWSIPDVCLHRNYVYYIDNSKSHPNLKRIQMGGTKTEVLFEPEGDRTMLYRMKGYGDFVFFQAGKYVGENLKAGIYAYNVQTGKIVLVKADAMREYYVVKNVLYYTANETMYSYDLKTGESKEFSFIKDDNDKSFFVDEKGIYVFYRGLGELAAYDEEGNQEFIVMDGQVKFCTFGEDGIFYGEALVEDTYVKAFLNVEEARTGDAGWVYELLQ